MECESLSRSFLTESSSWRTREGSGSASCSRSPEIVAVSERRLQLVKPTKISPTSICLLPSGSGPAATRRGGSVQGPGHARGESCTNSAIRTRPTFPDVSMPRFLKKRAPEKDIL